MFDKKTNENYTDEQANFTTIHDDIKKEFLDLDDFMFSGGVSGYVSKNKFGAKYKKHGTRIDLIKHHKNEYKIPSIENPSRNVKKI